MKITQTQLDTLAAKISHRNPGVEIGFKIIPGSFGDVMVSFGDKQSIVDDSILKMAKFSLQDTLELAIQQLSESE